MSQVMPHTHTDSPFTAHSFIPKPLHYIIPPAFNSLEQ